MKLLNLNQPKNRIKHDMSKPTQLCSFVLDSLKVSSTVSKVKGILRSKRGFTIMEAIISLLLLAILLTTIVSIIRFSTSMTAASIINAETVQDRFNALILEDFDGYTTGETTVTFSSTDIPDVTATHSIVLYEEDGVIVFTPDS